MTKRCLNALRDYDEWTYQHSLRVDGYAMKIGRCMGLNKEVLENLHEASLLHDIGKLAVPVSILNKPGKLTKQEYSIVKQHTRTGYFLLHMSHGYAEEVCLAVRDHHERYDGLGYESRTEVSFLARIICVADSFDAMSEDRPYKAAKSNEEIRTDLEANAGNQFDPDIAKIAVILFCN